MSITVHVDYDDGSNASNIRVYLDLGLFNGGAKSYTNRNGDAIFDINLKSTRTITFFADGSEYQTQTVKNGDCVYIKLK